MGDIAGVKHSNPVKLARHAAAQKIDNESAASELARHAAAQEIDSKSAASDEVKPCHVRGLNPKQ